VENGVVGIELCSRERILELEPKLSGDTVGGLYAPGGGVIEPYRFVFALVESALKNGVELHTDFAVTKARRNGDFWSVQSEDGRSINARYVVNAAGLFADEVSAIFAAEEFSIVPRKGEYFLMDRLTQASMHRVAFPVPTQVSKGMLVIPTVEGTVLVGPTANIVDDKSDLATVGEMLEGVFESGKNMVPSLSRNDAITSFAGLRPTLRWKEGGTPEGENPEGAPLEGDFYIAASKKAPCFVQVAGIESPGLTASPAIGEYVKNILRDIGLELKEKPGWDPKVEDHPRLRNLDPFTLDSMIAKDPAWGNIVCRCENVSEAEIVQAVRLGHNTLDGVKFFTRAQMGRCQGGFCTYKIIKIIMRETGLSWQQVTKHGGQSRILEGAL
jgi:glycerol-3-phosphate dehydrogenase